MLKRYNGGSGVRLIVDLGVQFVAGPVAGQLGGVDSVRRVLVVANQTLGGQDLLDAVASRMEQDACQFMLLVPAAPPDSASRSFADVLIGAPTGVEDHESGIAAAHERLDQGLASFRDMGATADGWVGPNDPVAAIRDVLKDWQFDEIIISTLPIGASRWLRRDVPHRVERAFQLPVTVITARSHPKNT